MLVGKHARHGACLLVFNNPKRQWEAPWGCYDGPPKHADVLDAAIDELFEETCGLVDCERAWLEAAPQCDVRLGRSGRKFGRLYALRVDGLARRHFKANRGALLALRAALKTRGPSRHPPRVVAVPVLNRLGDSAFWWLCSTACECAATGPF